MITLGLMQRIRDDLDPWEEPILWMYLHSEGLVTVGCGTMLPSITAAKRIPFVHRRTRLAAATSQKLRDDHVAAEYLELKSIYRGFDAFPEDAKFALFDMIYNLGPERAETRHHRAHGLGAYVHLNAAINAGNWALAAQHCSRHGIRPERNRTTATLFKNCATLPKSVETAHALP
jgi:GH24 family phage-related lysozyme (muramidase)